MAASIAHYTEMLVTESAGKRLLESVAPYVANNVTHLRTLVRAKLAKNRFVQSQSFWVNESLHPVQFLFGLGNMTLGLRVLCRGSLEFSRCRLVFNHDILIKNLGGSFTRLLHKTHRAVLIWVFDGRINLFWSRVNLSI